MADITSAKEALVALLYGCWKNAEVEWKQPGNSPKPLVKCHNVSNLLEAGFHGCNPHWNAKTKELITTYFPMDKKHNVLTLVDDADDALYKEGVTRPPPAFARLTNHWLQPDFPERARRAQKALPPAHFDRLAVIGSKNRVNDIDDGLDILYVMLGSLREEMGVGSKQLIAFVDLSEKVFDVIRAEYRTGRAHPAIRRNFPYCDREGRSCMRHLDHDLRILNEHSLPWSANCSGGSVTEYVKPCFTKDRNMAAMWMPDNEFNYFSELGKRLLHDAKAKIEPA